MQYVDETEKPGIFHGFTMRKSPINGSDDKNRDFPEF
jgi:hypothetical protein